MNIAIIHYHLLRGGVTQVVRNQLRALDHIWDSPQPLRVALLFSGEPPDWYDELSDSLSQVELYARVIPELNYDQSPIAQPANLADKISHALQILDFAVDDTILHVHNHSLGKNASTPGAVRLLAERGYRCLLQIHDFAEDFRPANYRHLVDALAQGKPDLIATHLYPQASHIHYALLNARDLRILSDAGTANRNLHALPNPIDSHGELPDRVTARQRVNNVLDLSPSSKYLLYPVRGIRRKNIGEAVFWSSVYQGDVTVAVTQPPSNPIERPAFEDWKAFVDRHRLPCLFDVGQLEATSFVDQMAAADGILTTSVAEGFGMVYLECWLANQRLVGRDLPEITADFVDSGLMLGELYDELPIPIDWVGRDEYATSIRVAYQHVISSCGLANVDDSIVDTQIDEMTQNRTVDFSTLSSIQQRRVIEIVMDSEENRQRFLDGLSVVFENDNERVRERIAANRLVVEQDYSASAIGRRLLDILTQVQNSEIDRKIQPLSGGDRVVKSFLRVDRMQPIRFES